ncbi:DNA-binding LacI/PurR family transcriptional regulator [Saccharothrix carnea]|uniref:DNA-binding LacI/PurR family transcriptional regulator n=1 Tax=Saccharothrix carnea TaxID=1280637 RepID=A0A2P8I1X9_SACCR|nr:LacI family DNA-binding transcriptional regulator [Saccharothrix carnea]PSL52471.1 DNA-binding LacI/PurR family transcriptional regulator [Saccharothrix carnea]
MSDIAREAGVSKVAVSYALNGRSGVSEATRRRILEIAARLGWRPNSAALALAADRTHVIGLAVPRPARALGVEPFFMGFLSGIEAELAEHEFSLLLHVVTDQDEEIETYRRWSAGRMVDGVIVVDLRTDDVRVPVLGGLGLHAVVAGGPAGLGGLPGLWTDDDAALDLAVDHLAAFGHRRIARVAEMTHLSRTAVRTEALSAATRRRGLPEPIVVTSEPAGDEGARATRLLLARPERPTAIFYDNDVMAVAALGTATEMGVQVPGRLSVLAWDDSVLCELVRPRLTALARDNAGYGARVARLLLDRVHNGREQAEMDLASTLHIRDSTGPAA